MLVSASRRPPRPPLFPYTTLFRSVIVPERPPTAPPASPPLPPLPPVPAVVLAFCPCPPTRRPGPVARDRKSTRLNSSHVETSYAVFCLKKKRTLETPSGHSRHGTL